MMGRIQILRRSDTSTYGISIMERLIRKTMTVGLTIKDIMKKANYPNGCKSKLNPRQVGTIMEKENLFLSRQAMNVGQKVYNTCSLMGLLLLNLLTSWQGFGTRSTHMRHFIFKAINLRIPTAEHTVTKCCIGQFGD